MRTPFEVEGKEYSSHQETQIIKFLQLRSRITFHCPYDLQQELHVGNHQEDLKSYEPEGHLYEDDHSDIFIMINNYKKSNGI